MEKVTYLKEQELKKKAQKEYENFLENSNVQNPIEAKLASFKKTKKEINPKDLL